MAQVLGARNGPVKGPRLMRLAARPACRPQISAARSSPLRRPRSVARPLLGSRWLSRLVRRSLAHAAGPGSLSASTVTTSVSGSTFRDSRERSGCFANLRCSLSLGEGAGAARQYGGRVRITPNVSRLSKTVLGTISPEDRVLIVLHPDHTDFQLSGRGVRLRAC